MNDGAEIAAARLWRDRAEIRERERNEALAQARLAEARCALLAAENERLRLEVARLRAFASLDPKQPKQSEIEAEMEALRTALFEVLPACELTPKELEGSECVLLEKAGTDASQPAYRFEERSGEEPRLPPATWDFSTAYLNPPPPPDCELSTIASRL